MQYIMLLFSLPLVLLEFVYMDSSGCIFVILYTGIYLYTDDRLFLIGIYAEAWIMG